MSEEDSSHGEAISQFVAFTGADEDRAKKVLEACAWNLELAINLETDVQSRSSTRTTNVGSGNTASGRSGNPDYVRPPIPPVRQILNPGGYSGTARRYTGRADASTSNVRDAFSDFRAEAEWQEMALNHNEASTSDIAGSADPSHANERRTLHELFRPPLDLMFRGSLISAREAGSLQNKWLLVNVQDSREFACQTLNRDVWSNQAVKEILKEHFLFWQVNHNSSEGIRYTQFYNVLSFPHISIVDPRTGEQMKSWPPFVDHNSFCDSVVDFLADHPSPDEPIVYEEKIEDYQKYLGTDKEKFSTLVIRFPDGSRDQFKFPSDTLMKALFLFLSSKGYNSKEYSYVTTFPRRLLHELPSTNTLSDAKLIRETIFVERRSGDD